MQDFYGSRAAIEALYTDRCDVWEWTPTRRADGVTAFQKRMTLRDVPCRLSYGNVPRAKQNDKTAHITGTVTLFVPPEAEIKPGSEVVVTRRGQRIALKSAGARKIYATHAEITAEPAETEA